jgi:phosphatidate cytidylyltransferase
MLRRTLTALLLIPPVLYLIGWSPKWLFLLALLATVEIGLVEFFSICRQAGFKSFPWVGYVAAAALCIVQALRTNQAEATGFLLIVLIVLLIPTLGLRGTSDLKGYIGATTVTVFGIVYIGLTLSCLLPIRYSEPATGWAWLGRPDPSGLPAGSKLMLLLFLIIWAGDIFAYAAGRTIGRTFITPRISPRKTLEGALGGFAGSLLVAGAFTHWFWQTADLKKVILLSAYVAIAGQVGDLVESALKRSANVKDSGTLLPGHGGFLDRIDSLLFGAPVLWLVLALRSLWS